jgi:hypothetical protein
MTMAMSFFGAKSKRMCAAISALERVVEDKDNELRASEDRLMEKLDRSAKLVSEELQRQPVAGALVWRGRQQ